MRSPQVRWLKEILPAIQREVAEESGVLLYEDEAVIFPSPVFSRIQRDRMCMEVDQEKGHAQNFPFKTEASFQAFPSF